MKRNQIISTILILFLFTSFGCKDEKSSPVTSSSQLPKNDQVLKVLQEKAIAVQDLTRKYFLEKYKTEVKSILAKVKTKIKNNSKNRVTQLAPIEDIAMEYSNAMVGSSYSYVNDCYGVNLYDYYSPGDPTINLIALTVAGIEDAASQGYYVNLDDVSMSSNMSNHKLQSKNTFSNGIQSENSIKSNMATMKMPQWLECLGYALAMDLSIWAYGERITAAAISRFATKMIAKYAGWFGAAVATYTFMECMDWI